MSISNRQCILIPLPEGADLDEWKELLKSQKVFPLEVSQFSRMTDRGHLSTDSLVFCAIGTGEEIRGLIRDDQLRHWVQHNLPERQRTLMLTIIDASGEIPIEDLRDVMGWSGKSHDAWSGYRSRINVKLKSAGLGVQIQAEKGKATIRRLSAD